MSGPALILGGYGVLLIVELYLFMLQRTALLVVRAKGLATTDAQLMLPSAFAALWPIRLARYALIYFIYTTTGLLAALAALIAPMLLATVLPIPYAHFLSRLERIASRKAGPNTPEYAAILVALLGTAPADLVNAERPRPTGV